MCSFFAFQLFHFPVMKFTSQIWPSHHLSYHFHPDTFTFMLTIFSRLHCSAYNVVLTIDIYHLVYNVGYILFCKQCCSANKLSIHVVHRYQCSVVASLLLQDEPCYDLFGIVLILSFFS